MTTEYQMWLTYNAESEKLRIPVLPQQINVNVGGNSASIRLAELGEIIIKQARAAFSFSFESFFPKTPFPGLRIDKLPEPLQCVEKIKGWMEGDKPVHLILTSAGVNTFCVIESFSYYEQGGDIGTIYYSISLKEYREVTARKVRVAGEKAAVTTSKKRVDNTVTPETYTIKKGDCLWNIAKKFYGDGAKYALIYQANRDKIKNPALIYAGQILKIPKT